MTEQCDHQYTLKQRLVEAWSAMPQRVIDEAIEHQKNSGGIGVGSLFSAENLQYL